ncbi:Ig-like domain-containing protein [Pseudomonas sp. PDM18]|uniref:Ig-like domain-containing protein n=2 Tax=Pseudomonas sp. PDM18 TaxID=2769253 RepID=UPI00298BEEB6|nr:Ig-like domain-containing protein [Pseudomonas sp. PDM18]
MAAPDAASTQLTIDTVAGDDIVNLAESQVQQTISGKASGEFQVGDVVSFKLNGTTYSAAVAADGKWSVQVSGADLAKATSIDATLVAHDAAGNTGLITANHGYTVDTKVKDVELVIDVIAGDDIVNLAESQAQQAISGKATGAFTAGDVVSFELNGTTYSTTVAADGKWSVQVAGADLAKASSIKATLVAHDDVGNVSNVEANRAYTVDVTAPDAASTQLTIDTVAGDDIVNQAESQVQQTISGKATGEFKAGDVVSFKLNGITYSAAVAADGKWSVQVAGSDLAKATSIDATLVAHDAAGNTGLITANHGYTVVTEVKEVALVIDVIAGDDIVNLAESQAQQAISGKVTGTFTAGDVVSFELNGSTYSTTVAADGKWSVQVAGADLAKASSIKATLVAHDDIGNTNTVEATRSYAVDVKAPVATLSINVVADDDIVNLSDSVHGHTISGKAFGEFRTGDLVTFTLNGTAYSAKVAANGAWSVQVNGYNLSKETNIHATLKATDAAGNVANVVADRGYTVDMTPPVAQLTIYTVAGDDVLNATEAKMVQTISGKAAGEYKAGDVVKFVLNGTTYQTMVNAAGDWSVQVAGSDLAKANSINATLVAHDAAGNSADITASRLYEVQVTPPKADLIIDAIAGDDIVNSNESKAQQTISGKVTGDFTAGDKVSFMLNGSLHTATVAADGKWSVQVAGADLAKGSSIKATLVAHDGIGNSISVEATRAYTVDVTPPSAATTQLTIDTVAGDDIVNLAESKVQQTISGKATGEFQAGDVVSFKLNGTTYSAAVAADGKWSVQVAGADLAKGSSINATLAAHDSAGNTGSIVADRGYAVDVTAPVATLSINVIAVDDIVNAAEAAAKQTISGKATGEFKAGDLVTFTLNGTTYSAQVAASGTWSVQVNGADLAKETSIHATLKAQDAAGNVADIVADRAYSVDTTAPNKPAITDILDDVGSITGSIANGGATDDNKPTLKGTGEANSIIHIKDGSTTIGSTTVGADGKWTFTPTTARSDGSHSFTAVSEDKAGNKSVASDPYVIVIDTVAPAAPVITSVFDDVGVDTGDISKGGSTDDSRPTISGTAEKNSVVTIYDNGVVIGSTTADASGKWSFEPSKDLLNGGHELTAKSTDVVGNQSSLSESFGFRVSTPISGTWFEDFNSTPERIIAIGETAVSGTELLVVTNISSRPGDIAPTGFKQPEKYTATTGLTFASGTIRVDLKEGLKGDSISFDLRDLQTNRSYVQFYDAEGALIQKSMLIPRTGSSSTDPVHQSFTMPAGKSFTYFTIYSSPVGTGSLNYDWMHIDDVSITGTYIEPAPRIAAGQIETESTEQAAAASDFHQILALQSGAQLKAHQVSGLAETHYGSADDSVVTLQYVQAEQFLASADNQGIHGGAGIDVLKVEGYGQVLDLTQNAAHGKVTGMEIIDLHGAGNAANSLKLSLMDVLDNGQADLFHSTDKHSVQMMVQGDSSDTVTLDHLGRDGSDVGTWTEKGTVAIGDASYHLYQHAGGDAELLIQEGMRVHLV